MRGRIGVTCPNLNKVDRIVLAGGKVTGKDFL